MNIRLKYTFRTLLSLIPTGLTILTINATTLSSIPLLILFVLTLIFDYISIGLLLCAITGRPDIVAESFIFSLIPFPIIFN